MAKQTPSRSSISSSVSKQALTPPAKQLFGDRVNFAIMVATIVAAAVAVGSFAYSMGKDAGEAELKTRQDLASVNFPQIAADARTTTADLKTATAAFKDLLVNNVTYQQAMAKQAEQITTITKLTANVSTLTAQNKAQQDTIRNLETKLAAYENPERIYDLKKGQSQQVGGGELIVGLQYNLGSFAEITINSQRYSAQPGDVIDLKGMKGADCRVKVTSLTDNDAASFSASCSK